jgi:hypothetical protein
MKEKAKTFFEADFNGVTPERSKKKEPEPNCF